MTALDRDQVAEIARAQGIDPEHVLLVDVTPDDVVLVLRIPHEEAAAWAAVRPPIRWQSRGARWLD